MDKRFSEEIFNQKRFGKLICKWILACVLFSLQRRNIPAANNFPAFLVPKCILPHTAPPDFTVLATASYTYRPGNTTFPLKQNPTTKLPILTPLRISRKDSASGGCWRAKSRGYLILELECDFNVPDMSDLGVCV